MKVLKVKTILKEGEVLQYDGKNIKEISDIFKFEYTEFDSCTHYVDKEYKDIKIITDEFHYIELLPGDYVFKDSKGSIKVIPIYDFSEYWEII